MFFLLQMFNYCYIIHLTVPSCVFDGTWESIKCVHYNSRYLTEWGEKKKEPDAFVNYGRKEIMSPSCRKCCFSHHRVATDPQSGSVPCRSQATICGWRVRGDRDWAYISLLKRLVDFHLCEITGSNSESRWKTLQQGGRGLEGMMGGVLRERCCEW